MNPTKARFTVATLRASPYSAIVLELSLGKEELEELDSPGRPAC